MIYEWKYLKKKKGFDPKSQNGSDSVDRYQINLANNWDSSNSNWLKRSSPTQLFVSKHTFGSTIFPKFVRTEKWTVKDRLKENVF